MIKQWIEKNKLKLAPNRTEVVLIKVQEKGNDYPLF